jgi:hypothetical protein
MSEQQESVSPPVPSASSVSPTSSVSPDSSTPSATPTAQSPEKTAAGVPEMMVGRWIWFGLQRFAEAEWNTICQQAAAWKVQGLHPKVADGIYRWYDDAGLLMLKQVAQRHGLRVVPYHYCYGPQFGASQITAEAEISAWAGKVFGAVIPDIEDQYMGQYDSAETFGKEVRARFNGLWMPTLYPNPEDHPVPLLSLNPYMDAWLPQVYFAEWNGIAQSAIDYVYPQWLSFDQRARKAGLGSLKPILPIISLENGVAAAQIADFIVKMHGYGYIGFWHYGNYSPYASAIQQTPLPSPSSPPVPPSPPPPPALLSFNDDDRQVWTLCGKIVVNEHAAIEQSWLRARHQKGWNFGPPLEQEHDVKRGSKHYIEQQFSAARASWEVDTGLLTWWTAHGPVRV